MSLPIKVAVAFVFLLTIVSFVFSLKYSGENRIVYSTLQLYTNILPPICSSNGGFYSDAFSISLLTSNSSKIYYTLDGSEPSLKSEIYSQSILIQDKTFVANNLSNIPTSPRWQPPIGDVFKGTVVRAICVNEKNQKSQELIRTFIINKRRHTIAVVALTVNADDFFGYKNGIYVLGKNYDDKKDYAKKGLRLNLKWWEYPSNYLKRGDNSERPVHLEFYESDGTLGFEINAGARISGNATRGFSQKSLRICFDEKYGASQLNYNLFPNKQVNIFNSFILRNSGNDWNKTMFRDAFMQSLIAENTHLEVQGYRPSIVYINGEYWGIHNIRERSDENYLANKYEINRDSIAVLELGGDVFYGKKNDDDEFKKLLEFVKTHDLSKADNYKNLERKIDLLSFMDFIISNVYFCNSDWPNNNVKFWRFKSEKQECDSLGFRDGRWRWMLFDTDWGFGYTDKNAFQLNLLEKAKMTGSTGILFNGLLQNKTFEQEFKVRFSYHLDHTFATDVVIKKIDQFQQTLDPEIRDHINRWRVIGSYENWKEYVKELKDFALKRPSIQTKQLNDFFTTK
ncbi:MAG: CotH kinase family protein [Nitrosopumilus sp.]|nr:CotH kinase family protein [Nitrosopumilus sp.]